MARRRSIVDFERWLDQEIENAKQDLAGSNTAAEEIARVQTFQQIRLETLQSVKVKVAPVDGEAEEVPVNGAAAPGEPELSLAFDADAVAQ